MIIKITKEDIKKEYNNVFDGDNKLTDKQLSEIADRATEILYSVILWEDATEVMDTAIYKFLKE